jgi:hypothetical protein
MFCFGVGVFMFLVECSVLYLCIRGIYQARKVGGHVFALGVSSQESGRSCICIRGIKPGKWAVMYLCIRGIYQARKVGGHVFVLGISSQESGRSCICVLGVSSQESGRSCICVLGVSTKPGKRAVMYVY